MDILLLPVNDIVVKEGRQRQEFDKEELKELAYRIKTHQLMQAPGINTPELKELVWGERRLRAIRWLAKQGIAIRYNDQEIPVGYVPVVNAGTTDELVLEELELQENKDRVNLTWQEEVRAIARIEELLKARKRREQGDAPTKDDILPEIVVKQSEIAEALGKSQGTVSMQKSLVEHLSDPEVAKAKSTREALKIVEKKRKAEHRQAMAEKTVIEKDSPHKIFHGDCLKVIKTFPDNFFRAIVTDPPYGIDMHKDQSWDGSWHDYDDTEVYALNLFQNLLPEWDRVTCEQAHVYAFCDFSMFEKLRALISSYRVVNGKPKFVCSLKTALLHNLGMEENKSMLNSEPVFDVMYFPFIWNKGNVASYPRPEHWPRKSYECVLYLIKGKHTQAKLDLAVVDIPQIQIQEHEAGKPLALYEHFMLRSTLAGEAVLDCFAGQGNLLRAAAKHNRVSYSVELADKYYPLLAEAYNECK